MFFEYEFEYDLNKSRKNAKKHGIGFETVKKLWLDPYAILNRVEKEPEERWMVIAQLNRRCWTAVFTYRGNRIRIISARRATKREVNRYEKAKRRRAR